MSVSQPASHKSFSGNALYIFLIRFFPSLANVLIVILFSRGIDEHSYGIYQNFWIHLYVISTIACLGFQSFIIAYTPSLIRAIYRRLQWVHAMVFIVWLVLAGTAFAYLQCGPLGNVVLPFVFIMLYTVAFIAEALLISFKQYRNLVVVNIGYTCLFLLLHIGLLYGRYTISQLFMYVLLLVGLRLLLLLPQAFRHLNTQQDEAVAYDINNIRSLWLHIGVYDISQMLFRWIDKFVISLLFTEQVSAIYFNGSMDVPFLPLLLGAAAGAALMQMAHAGDGNDAKYAVKLGHHSSKLLSAIVFPCFFFLVFYRYELFSVLLSEKYIDSVPIFLVSTLAIPLRAYSFTAILQNRHKGKVINLGAVLDLVLACALMYPLYQMMGLPGVALAFVVSSYLQAAYYLYHTAIVLQVPVFSLLPLANLAWKLIGFALLFIAFHYACVQYFSPQFVLLSGMGLTASAAIITVWCEYKSAH